MVESDGRQLSRAGTRVAGTKGSQRGAGSLGLVPEQTVAAGLPLRRAYGLVNAAGQEGPKSSITAPGRRRWDNAPCLRKFQGWFTDLDLYQQRYGKHMGEGEAAGF